QSIISNPPADNFVKTEAFGPALYLANRGFDVYSMDERRTFVPITLNSSQVSFVKDWGWDVLMSDYREAVLKTKEVSGVSKIFMMGLGTGAIITKNYASEYWAQDLMGTILLSPQNLPATTVTNSYNLTKALADMNSAGTWGKVNVAYSDILNYRFACDNPGAPVPTPQPISTMPPFNPMTNKSWTNITEYYSFALTYASGFGGIGGLGNYLGGYGNITEILYNFANATVYIPTRLDLETAAMADWNNCPYVTYDFDNHYKDVNVPTLTIAAGLYKNSSGQFQFVNDFATSDFTAIYLAKYGEYDIFFGTNSVKDVNQPIYQWLVSHYTPPSVSAFTSVTVLSGQTWYFFANSAGSMGPMTYQWYEGTTKLAGQTDMVLPITKTAAGTYTFSCQVTDAEGMTANSNTVALTVLNK
ncbi:MAG TPA: hypothetical protein VMD05_06420, partial [Candidatus Nanoarchaeia archaeon]|nr:hypothetical protein [Candidatus Nanoarchaeia archaeon]